MKTGKHHGAKKAHDASPSKRHFQLKPPVGISDLLARVNALPAEEPDFDSLLRSGDAEALMSWSRDQELFEARRLLKTLAFANRSEFIRSTGGDFQLGLTGYDSPYRLQVALVVHNGKLEFAPESVLASVLRQPVNQIRICGVCSVFFWAGRPKQVCCSPRCARILRMRRWRNPNRKCECGHARNKHFKATKSIDAGCDGNGHTCECRQFKPAERREGNTTNGTL